jgi:hypothetical protein
MGSVNLGPPEHQQQRSSASLGIVAAVMFGGIIET